MTISRKAMVTGGSGFIGAFLTRKLVELGWQVVVVDNMTRGIPRRLDPVVDNIDLQTVDVRDADALTFVAKGCDVVFHLAAINGTENFYQRPEQVLDVGIRGALAVVQACRTAGVPDLVVASSAEVYQTPPTVPTDETVALMLPDSLNPRYSYGGSKIASELIAFNYAQEHFQKVQVFRPHNVYGPDMGYKHVVPQFALRALDLASSHTSGPVPFPIQGSGEETRAFCYVEDAVDGIVRMYEKGSHRNIYHIGNDDMVSIAALAAQIGECLGQQFELAPGTAPSGETPRRCPDISKMAALGYAPSVSLASGLSKTIKWYKENDHLRPNQDIL